MSIVLHAAIDASLSPLQQRPTAARQTVPSYVTPASVGKGAGPELPELVDLWIRVPLNTLFSSPSFITFQAHLFSSSAEAFSLPWCSDGGNIKAGDFLLLEYHEQRLFLQVSEVVEQGKSGPTVIRLTTLKKPTDFFETAPTDDAMFEGLGGTDHFIPIHRHTWLRVLGNHPLLEPCIRLENHPNRALLANVIGRTGLSESTLRRLKASNERVSFQVLMAGVYYAALSCPRASNEPRKLLPVALGEAEVPCNLDEDVTVDAVDPQLIDIYVGLRDFAESKLMKFVPVRKSAMN
jgi:hypothetical protein